MKNINDLEKGKFYSDEGNLSIKNESVSYGGEVNTGSSLDDLEFNKFNSEGEIRVVVSF